MPASTTQDKTYSKPSRISENLSHGLMLIVTIILMLIPAFYLLIQIGAFEKEPVMTIKAKNSFEKTLKVAADFDFMPYSYMDKDGDPAGHDIEVINEIANRLEMNVNIMLMSWPVATASIEDGTADLVLSKEVSVKTLSENPAISMPMSFDSMQLWGKKKLGNLAELNNKMIGIIEDDAFLDELTLTTLCVPMEMQNYKELFAACERGACDYVLCQHNVGNAIRYKCHFTLEPKASLSATYLGIAASKDNSALINRINDTLTAMSQDGTLTSIRHRWLDSYGKHRPVKEVVIRHRDMFIVFNALLAGWFIVCAFMLSIEKYKARNASIYAKLSLQATNDMNMLTTLSMDFDAVFAVDMDTDEISTIRINERYTQDVERVETEKNFYARIMNGIEKNIYPDDREYVSRMFSKDNIMSTLAQSDTFTFSYRINAHGSPRHTTARISKADVINGKRIFILGIRASDSENDAIS